MIPGLLSASPGHWRVNVEGARSGSSGAEVHILDCVDGRQVAVKRATSARVSARRQAAAREQIAPYFSGHLPQVLWAGRHQGSDVLVTECPSTRTLADAAGEHGPTCDLLTTWAEIVDHVTAVWMHSAQPGYKPHHATRSHPRRLQRAIDGLDHALTVQGVKLTGDYRFTVNGADLGSWSLLHHRLAALPPPTFRVACLGDPQPTNILLTTKLRWYLIDWEWAGHHHDWRMMVSHLLGWWFVEDLLDRIRGTLHVSKNHIAVTYPPPNLDAIGPWLVRPAHAFQAMTTPWTHDRDQFALCLHMAMLLLREIPRDPREHLIAPLLGEALRLVDGAHHGPPHPLHAAGVPAPRSPR